jgi:signal transduction histidine kinase
VLRRFWPRSLQGQVLLALALALLLAQAISLTLLFQAGDHRRTENLTHTLALRLFNNVQRHPELRQGGARPESEAAMPAQARVLPDFAPIAGDRRWPEIESRLARILAEQDIATARVVVVDRDARVDPIAAGQAQRRRQLFGPGHAPQPERVLIAAVQQRAGGPWLVARALLPNDGAGPRVLGSLLLQTVVIYLVLVGTMALVLRRIARPLARLTERVESFARNPGAGGELAAEGPDDLRRLILAHNAMETRITALLDEKDVMLGAIGHDLKTPLTALRVRIESIEDERERQKMAATIEDIVRSLDDLLSLARVGRPTDPLEPTELSALTASVAEEYEDMGEPVTISRTTRIVLPLRTTWLRRALRNLIGNGLRYGEAVQVALAREAAGGRDWAVVQVEDDGPGIPEADIGRMMNPFTRGEPSRNSATGGAGLGLALARAIAVQHGGELVLANRRDSAGTVIGLTASLRLPL